MARRREYFERFEGAYQALWWVPALLARNDTQAQALGIRGTPGIVVGRQMLPGIVGLDGLKQLVAASRNPP